MSNCAMNNETDLNWLARSVHVWSDGMREVLVCHPHNVDTLIWSCVPSNVGWITKEQWLTRRAELQNKPSWKDAPEWATHLSQDENGAWRFMTEPHNVTWIPGCTYHEKLEASTTGLVLGDWRDTLEKRPVDLSERAVTDRLTEATQNVLAAAPALMDEKLSFDRNDWFGRGELPPVGAMCEAGAEGCKFEKCEILGFHKGQVALRWFEFNNGCLDVLGLDGWSFRPIRTEREELEILLRSTALSSFDDLDIIAGAIIAAGFRKEKK